MRLRALPITLALLATLPAFALTPVAPPAVQREEVGNRRMAIVLRTGQPGDAPVRDERGA